MKPANLYDHETDFFADVTFTEKPFASRERAKARRRVIAIVLAFWAVVLGVLIAVFT